MPRLADIVGVEGPPCLGTALYRGSDDTYLM
jgi:hypothetical protein